MYKYFNPLKKNMLYSVQYLLQISTYRTGSTKSEDRKDISNHNLLLPEESCLYAGGIIGG